jgi:hypothetical protein
MTTRSHRYGKKLHLSPSPIQVRNFANVLTKLNRNPSHKGRNEISLSALLTDRNLHKTVEDSDEDAEDSMGNSKTERLHHANKKNLGQLRTHKSQGLFMERSGERKEN